MASWTPPAFTPGVAWQDSPSAATPLSAANLNLDENTEASYAANVGTSLYNYLLANTTSRSASGATPLVLPSANGGAFVDTLTGNVVYSAPSGASAGTECNLDLLLQQDATGSRTVTWFSGITWLPGAPPSLPIGPNQVMLISLVSLNGGTTWFGYYNSGQGAMPPWPSSWFQPPVMGANSAHAHVANTLYVAAFTIPGQATITGFGHYNAPTVSGNMQIALFDHNGNQVAASVSTPQGSASTQQRIPFSAAYAAAAGIYYAGYQFDNGSAQTYDCPWGTPAALQAQGSFALPASLTPPTTPTTSIMPQFTTY